MIIVPQTYDISTPDGLLQLNVRSCTLVINRNVSVNLSYTQARLFYVLMNGITQKEEIIRSIWGEDDAALRYDNNYHQLIFQTRRLLKQHTFSGEILKTVPRYGLKINLQPIRDSHHGLKNRLTKLFRRD